MSWTVLFTKQAQKDARKLASAAPALKQKAQALLELLPIFGRLRVMRQWAGICDISPDSSPIAGKTPLENLFISTGWGTGGFKAIPAGGDTLAWTIAHGHTHELLQPFQLDRFTSGHLVIECVARGDGDSDVGGP